MAYFNTPIQAERYFSLSNVVQLRFGQREMRIHKDFRKRLYRANPIIECCAGPNAGHLEILLFGCWLVVFSKAAIER